MGRHDGIARYTVGQGKRLGPAAMDRGERQMVLASDPATRRIVIGPRHAGTTELRLSEVNWLIPIPAAPIACRVKLRAREAPQPAIVVPTSWGAEVRMAAPVQPAPGQACVFYAGERILGGGFIRRPDWRPDRQSADPGLGAGEVDGRGPGGLSPAPLGLDGGVAQR
jgi:tRNA-specific 2-thiouridylase